MTPMEYMHKKNALIEDATGLTLIPENQIKDIEIKELSLDNDIYACPYCEEYYPMGGDTECNGCPMFEKENSCFAWNSSYRGVMNSLERSFPDHYGVSIVEHIPGIEDLVIQYNKENGFTS